MGTPWSKGKTLVDLVVDRYVNLDLFNRKQQPRANSCIEWTGVRSNIGYGFIGFTYANGKKSAAGKDNGMMTVHRLAFMVANNRLPGKRNVNHTCHNKLCVNPAHLVEGTQQEKLTAMLKDGVKIGGRVPGVKIGAYNHKQTNRNYKYSEEEIQWVRSATSSEIAERYNIPLNRAATMRGAFRKGYKWLKEKK